MNKLGEAKAFTKAAFREDASACIHAACVPEGPVLVQGFDDAGRPVGVADWRCVWVLVSDPYP